MNEYIMAGLFAAFGLGITILLNWILRRTIDLQTRELRVLLAHIVKGVKDLDEHLIDLVGILSESQAGVEKMEKSVSTLTRAVAPAAQLAGDASDTATGVFDGVGSANGWWEKGEALINNLIGRKIDKLAEGIETMGIDKKKPLTRKQRREAKQKAKLGMTEGERQLEEMGVEVQPSAEESVVAPDPGVEKDPGPL